MTKDYSEARYWAISGMGYGKGFTPEEAVENYVVTQMRNYRVKDTVFKTKKEFETALRTGEVRPAMFRSPEGYTGFQMGMGSQWVKEVDGVREFKEFEMADRVFTFGGEYAFQIRVEINDFDETVTVFEEGETREAAQAAAVAAVESAMPYATVTAVG